MLSTSLFISEAAELSETNLEFMEKAIQRITGPLNQRQGLVHR
jgi:hypothetical protein